MSNSKNDAPVIGISFALAALLVLSNALGLIS